MYMTTGSLRSAGYDGSYWGVNAYQSTLYAYNLDFNSANVGPSDNNDRWDGFTVRKAIKTIIIGRRIDIIITKISIINILIRRRISSAGPIIATITHISHRTISQTNIPATSFFTEIKPYRTCKAFTSSTASLRVASRFSSFHPHHPIHHPTKNLPSRRDFWNLSRFSLEAHFVNRIDEIKQGISPNLIITNLTSCFISWRNHCLVTHRVQHFLI